MPLEFWRPEVIHFLLAQFPLALLVFGLLFRLLSWLFRGRREFLKSCSGLLIVLGTLALWGLYFTGKAVSEELHLSLCYPEVGVEHGKWAFYSAVAFTAGIFLDVIPGSLQKSGLALPVFKGGKLEFIMLLYFAASTAALAHSTFLGTEMVFQQGVGVQTCPKVEQRKIDSAVER